QALVEQPEQRAADARERLRGGRARGAERVEVEVLALAEARGDDARRRDLTVRVQQQRLAALPAELAGRRELRQLPAELVVEDLRAVAGQGSLDHRNCERVGLRLAGERDLDGDAHGGAMLLDSRS